MTRIAYETKPKWRGHKDGSHVISYASKLKHDTQLGHLISFKITSDTQIHRQKGDIITPLEFYSNKESRLKLKLDTTIKEYA
jgi:hypothetical protein